MSVLFNSTSHQELINDLKSPLMDKSDFEDVPSRKIIKNPTKKTKIEFSKISLEQWNGWSITRMPEWFKIAILV